MKTVGATAYSPFP